MTESIGTDSANPLKLVCPAEGYEDILSEPALNFLQALCTEFSSRIEDLLADRVVRQAEFDKGELPNFLEETKEIGMALGKYPRSLKFSRPTS